jgi:hypothetical protein
MAQVRGGPDEYDGKALVARHHRAADRAGLSLSRELWVYPALEKECNRLLSASGSPRFVDTRRTLLIPKDRRSAREQPPPPPRRGRAPGSNGPSGPLRRGQGRGPGLI